MKIFIDISTGKIKEPKNWLDIFSEYSELSGSKHIRERISRLKHEENRVFIMNQVIFLSVRVPDNKDIKSLCLKLFGRLITDEKSLKACVNIMKSTEQRLKNDIEEAKTQSKNEMRSIGDIWAEQIAILSKYQGYRIDTNVVSVLEYMHILNIFKKEIELNRTKSRKNE